jgi:hypothetical protein
MSKETGGGRCWRIGDEESECWGWGGGGATTHRSSNTNCMRDADTSTGGRHSRVAWCSPAQPKIAGHWSGKCCVQLKRTRAGSACDAALCVAKRKRRSITQPSTLVSDDDAPRPHTHTHTPASPPLGTLGPTLARHALVVAAHEVVDCSCHTVTTGTWVVGGTRSPALDAAPLPATGRRPCHATPHHAIPPRTKPSTKDTLSMQTTREERVGPTRERRDGRRREKGEW